jgi:hypothetical protein
MAVGDSVARQQCVSGRFAHNWLIDGLVRSAGWIEWQNMQIAPLQSEFPNNSVFEYTPYGDDRRKSELC